MIKPLRLLTAILLITHTGQSQSIPPACFNDVGTMLQTNGKVLTVELLRYAFTPAVVRQNSTQNVLFEAVTTGTPSAVNLYLDATQATIALNDKGINGDRQANDGIYSVTLAPPKGTWSDSFVGYTRMFENNQQVVQLNTFVGLLTLAMPLLQPKKIDNTSQSTDYIFNLVIASTLQDPTDGQKLSINQAFYKNYPDAYDFINYVMVPGYVGNRFHGKTANSVQGIGLLQFNSAAQYGSKGRLQGFTEFPVPSLFDGANNGFIHEIGHQWINYLATTLLKGGIPHWPLSNLAAGVMGLSIPGSGAGGQFSYTFTELTDGYRLDRTSVGDTPSFNQWELYLMGLIPASEVTIPALIFNDQTISSNINGGTIFPKTAFTRYQISDLLADVGTRSPAVAQSQTKFNMATILLSERLLTAEEISYFDFMAKRAEGQTATPVQEGLAVYMGKPFALATGNRARLQTLLNTNCSTLPAKPTITASGSLTICPGSSVVLTASSDGNLYTWYQNGIPLTQQTASISTDQAGTYTVSVKNASGCSSELSTGVVAMAGSTPPKPTITLGPDGLTSSSPVGNQWLLNGSPVVNAIAPSIKPGAGTYTVRVTIGGCSITSDPFVVTAIDDPITGFQFDLHHAPNPVGQSAQITFRLPKASSISLRLFTSTGVAIKTLVKGDFQAGQHDVNAPLHDVPVGLYTYQLETD